jgi:isopenicillin-N N-acyltransferase-like protein
VNTYPRLRISGDARQRGRAYGEQARERIQFSRDSYAEIFAKTVGWSWEQAVASAARYEKPIRDLAPDVMQEIEGIAEGSGLPAGDVLAINARTEIIFAASAREAAAQRAARARECTALNFVTLVEAGLLAKASMNSAGLGVVTNALVSSADRGEPGIPYHVMLRLMAGCETLTDALKVAQAAPRSSSANYLIAHADDVAVNVEAAPGDFRALSWQIPQDGSLAHTNHFLSLPPGVDEVSLYAMPDSLIRLQRVAGELSGSATWDVKAIGELLSDHAGWPPSICGHPDPRMRPIDQDATVLSVVMDLAQRQMWLASGNPCTHPFEQLSFGGLLDKPSSLSGARDAALSQTVSNV